MFSFVFSFAPPVAPPIAVACAGIPWVDAIVLAQQRSVGLAWVVAMLRFEIEWGLALGVPIARIATDHGPGRGGGMPFGLLALFAAPALAATARGLK